LGRSRFDQPTSPSIGFVLELLSYRSLFCRMACI
jgi:hypothetical protein